MGQLKNLNAKGTKMKNLNLKKIILSTLLFIFTSTCAFGMYQNQETNPYKTYTIETSAKEVKCTITLIGLNKEDKLHAELLNLPNEELMQIKVDIEIDSQINIKFDEIENISKYLIGNIRFDENTVINSEKTIISESYYSLKSSIGCILNDIENGKINLKCDVKQTFNPSALNMV